MKKMLYVLSVTVFIAVYVSTYCYAGPVNRWYYGKFPATLEEIQKTYGKPIDLQKQADGTEKYVFAASGNTMDLGHPFFIVKEGAVVDAGIQ